MKYKLLVLDVDGTLLNNEKEISKRTLASLLKEQLQEQEFRGRLSLFVP